MDRAKEIDLHVSLNYNVLVIRGESDSGKTRCLLAIVDFLRGLRVKGSWLVTSVATATEEETVRATAIATAIATPMATANAHASPDDDSDLTRLADSLYSNMSFGDVMTMNRNNGTPDSSLVNEGTAVSIASRFEIKPSMTCLVKLCIPSDVVHLVADYGISFVFIEANSFRSMECLGCMMSTGSTSSTGSTDSTDSTGSNGSTSTVESTSFTDSTGSTSFTGSTDSTGSCVRVQYVDLCTKTKSSINHHLRKFYPNHGTFTISETTHGSLASCCHCSLVANSLNQGGGVELKFKGASFQHMFATLVRLYALVEECEERGDHRVILRYFIIDTPENSLHPMIVQDFFATLVDICESSNIRIVAASHHTGLATCASNSRILSLGYASHYDCY